MGPISSSTPWLSTKYTPSVFPAPLELGKDLYVIPPPIYEDMSLGPYLVESCGDILAIGYKRDARWTNYKFFIHLLKFDNGKGNPCWVKLSSIGDRILFFDFPLSTGRGFGLRASDFAGFKGNCIYFVYNGIPYIDRVKLINMYDIENGSEVVS
ncbi:hypothetical protein FCM35_KLT19823 [Carex littledalei]|uniref:KIB1-4 beta-propeller domain-containing protein n=1 Tax=Carex littledalei TaxID=544730 RepID=A0A833RFY3_9POAL|nr:hypothetical protein FCM35_KLT19823 [Carex littledalei]